MYVDAQNSDLVHFLQDGKKFCDKATFTSYLQFGLHTASLGGQGGLSYFLCYVMYLSILHTTKIQDKFENKIKK